MWLALIIKYYCWTHSEIAYISYFYVLLDKSLIIPNGMHFYLFTFYMTLINSTDAVVFPFYYNIPTVSITSVWVISKKLNWVIYSRIQAINAWNKWRVKLRQFCEAFEAIFKKFGVYLSASIYIIEGQFHLNSQIIVPQLVFKIKCSGWTELDIF